MIYFDMDGVVANFVKKMETLGVPFPFKDPEHLYKVMYENHRDLYIDLKTVSGYEYFFNYYIAHSDNVRFLSGVPDTWTDQMVEDAFLQKGQWLMRYMHKFELDHLIVCRTKDKPLYCNEGDYLVDDRFKTIDAWNNKKGIGLYYFADTLDVMQSRTLAQYVIKIIDNQVYGQSK